MKVGTVAGTVISTINIPLLDEHRLLLCDLQDVEGKPAGYTIAVDVVDAGVGGEGGEGGARMIRKIAALTNTQEFTRISLIVVGASCRLS